MKNSKGINDWIPLLTKLVWPFIILLALIIFNKQVSEVYTVVMKSIKEGRNVEIGGFLKLGEVASATKIGALSDQNILMDEIGGALGINRQSDNSQLSKIQQELIDDPTKTFNTILLEDGTTYSIEKLKQYIGIFSLEYIVFLKDNKFDGWIASSAFVAQLPKSEFSERYSYQDSKTYMIRKQYVQSTNSAKEVLRKMQELHLESLPVLDENNNWLFFTTRGEILASLMTKLMLEKEED